ncbi:ATP-binding protein [Streptomyces sp. NPDC021096]|uniref:ATP-binding protein n=1 Tax=Streptomyces sp. NPDC021096 TaxID=3154792 RepID=UPI0033C58E07
MATVSPTPPWSYILELPRDPRAPGIARVTTRAVLDSHGMTEIAPDATLLTCELVTNAYLHTDGPCSLSLRGLPGQQLRVGVWDTSPVVPPPFGGGTATDHGPVSEAGCGLVLLRMCADSWGSRTYDKRRFGKMLWFELAHPKRPMAGPRTGTYKSPVNCGECAALEAARRAAVAAGDTVHAEDAAIAVRSHFRHAHLLPRRGAAR